METLEDYDFAFHYYPRKTNIITDVMSRKNYGQFSSLWLRGFKMYVVIEDFELCLGWEGQGQCFYSMSARQKIIQKIIETHVHGEILEKVKA